MNRRIPRAQPIRLGIIGISEGNGHPYSWSAIFNGYNASKMERCPFPAIPAYLEKRRFPEDAVASGKVTHVWTDDESVSRQIAEAALIPNVVPRMEDLIGSVDAVLLARDDADQHLEMARPFLDAGLPIFIDKPLAFDVATAEELFDLQRYEGQLFTGSSLVYAPELTLTPEELTKLGTLRYLHCCVPKDWPKYSIHVIEPALVLIGEQGPFVDIQADGDQMVSLDVKWSSGLRGRFVALGIRTAPIAIDLFGDTGHRSLIFVDSFVAFRENLRAFIDVVLGRRPPQNREEVMKSIQLVETGCKALK